MLTNRQKLFAAVLGSALLHVLLLIAVGVMMVLQPPLQPSSYPSPEPLHVEIVKSEAPEPLAAPTPEHPVLDNSTMKTAEHPSAEAKFQGDKDTIAASAGPATGDKPLPSQEGRKAPSYAFDPSPPAPVAKTDSTPPQAAAPPETAPPPPAPSRMAARPPLVEQIAPTLVRNELALLDTQPTPSPEELNPYDPSFRSTAPPPPVPTRRNTPASAYKPMEAQTFSSGNITTRGTASVDAVATPYGRYQKALLDSIRVIWTQEIHARSDIASLGAVKCHFAVDRTGHVHTPRIVSNSSNEALASITLDAITTAPIPPMPPEVIETMDGAMLQLDVTFECL